MAQLEHTADAPLTDGVDPELMELPAPPQGRRVFTLVLMALVVVASLALIGSLRHDLAYYFATPESVELGDATTLDLATLRPNTHVRIRGTGMVSRAVRYRRVLNGKSYLVFPLAGQHNVYVQVEDTPEAMARTEFTGRLATFSQLGGRFDAVERYLQEDMGLPATGETFLVMADEGPDAQAWAFLVVLLSLGVILVDVLLFFRWFRPLGA